MPDRPAPLASLLIEPTDLRGQLDTSEQATIVDVRTPRPWEKTEINIRVAPVGFPLDTDWNKAGLLAFD